MGASMPSSPSAAPAPAGGNAQPQPAGQIGPTVRPKQRFIDKVLMRQREKNVQTMQLMQSLLGQPGEDEGMMR